MLSKIGHFGAIGHFVKTDVYSACENSNIYQNKKDSEVRFLIGTILQKDLKT